MNAIAKNINNKGIKIFTIILITFLLTALFVVSILLLNSYLKYISHHRDEKTKIRDNTQDAGISGRENEVNTGLNRNRVEREISNNHTDKIMFVKSDIANFTNEIARLNGFYILGEPEINKRDPNLVFKGELIKLPSGKKLIAKKNDSLWNYAIEALKNNFKENLEKISEFEKKIRNIKKRVLDIVQEVSIIKKEIEAAIKTAYVNKHKLILKELLNEVNVLPTR